MRYFLQQTQSSDEYHAAARGMRYLETPSYTEFEIPLADGSFGVVYLIPRDEKSFIACACMLDTFAYIVDACVAAEPESQSAILETFHETWPLVMELLSNGENGRFSPAALCMMEDPDDVVSRWFVATLIGNVGHMPAPNAAGNKRLMEGVARVVRMSESAIEEFHSIQIDVDLLSRRVMQAGVTANLKRVAKFVDSKFDSIVQLADILAKID